MESENGNELAYIFCGGGEGEGVSRALARVGEFSATYPYLAMHVAVMAATWSRCHLHSFYLPTYSSPFPQVSVAM